MSTTLGVPSLGAALISSESLQALKRDSDSFQVQIDKLSHEIEDHEQRIASLQQQRAVLQDAIEKILSLTMTMTGTVTEGLGSVDSILPEAQPAENGRVSALQPPTATLADQIEVVMKDAGAPLHYREILARLQGEGVDVGGKDPAATLLSILASKRYDARFARAERGVYTLPALLDAQPSPRPSKRRRRRTRAARPAGRKS